MLLKHFKILGFLKDVKCSVCLLKKKLRSRNDTPVHEEFKFNMLFNNSNNNINKMMMQKMIMNIMKFMMMKKNKFKMLKCKMKMKTTMKIQDQEIQEVQTKLKVYGFNLKDLLKIFIPQLAMTILISITFQ
ncbi:hypothetical protein OXYTRIMIC_673 [Oxytricha trifallax]|uniref:Uncharacterized protein n=1 Tax=Oxytricha trifallax TaxID=1172189 RepID=A0A073I097_9SPIT|nr:hypothetical protein OXYTRIMIC_673 [Oxytricha trifallax]